MITIGYESATKGFEEVWNSSKHGDVIGNWSTDVIEKLMMELYTPLKHLKAADMLKCVVCVRCYFNGQPYLQYGSI
jgi:hypothetical protein